MKKSNLQLAVPPFDSPIEEKLANTLAWCCGIGNSPGCSAPLYKQYECETRVRTFRLDLVAPLKNNVLIAFECDGKQFHLDREKDIVRDAIILGSRCVNAIFRYSGSDIYNDEHDMDLLSFALKFYGWHFHRNERFYRWGGMQKSPHLIQEITVPCGTGYIQEASYAKGLREEVSFVDNESGEMEVRISMKPDHHSLTKSMVREARFLDAHTDILHKVFDLYGAYTGTNFDEFLAIARNSTRRESA